MRLKFWGTICLVLLLVGCRTAEQFESDLDTWIGSSERELVSSWGPPTGFYESGGVRYLTWSERRTAHIPGVAPTYQTTIIGGVAYTSSYGGTSAKTLNMSCDITMILEQDKVTSWNYKGNDCN